jgi:DNA adenine methylase
LQDSIFARFPVYYEKYIEVFGGGGWVLFHKPPMNDFEVFNDFNPNLVTLYRCVRDKPDELITELYYVLDSREDFERIKKLFKTNSEMTDVQRAANFYQLIRYSYASGCDSFACQPHDMWSNFPLIYQAHRRLRKTVIENKDFENLIKQYDREISFFYCDPPYFNTENYYDNVSFTKADHERLRNILLNIQGKFLLSYNDCPEIRKLYNKPGIFIESISRINNLAQRYEGGSEYAELFISNYDTSELRNQNKQMYLFGTEEGEEII